MIHIIKLINIKVRYELQKYIQKHFPPVDGGVFVFHEVVDSMDDALDAEFAITTKEFSLFVDHLVKNGSSIGSYDTKKIDPNKFYFTFDDGYESLLKSAIPILEKYAIQHILFIPFDFIGKNNYLSENQLLELFRNNYSIIGGHSMNHRKLLDCNTDELTKEIIESKDQLEKMIGRKIDYFAYPYGSLDAVSLKAQKMARKAGYKYAFSTLCTSFKRDNQWFYPRITVTSHNYQEIMKLL